MIFELKQCLNIIKKRKWFIIIVTLLTTIGAAIISFHNTTPPIYLTVTTMVPVKISSINNVQVENSVTQFDKELMDTYSEIAQSKAVAIKASKKLNGTISADNIRGLYTSSSRTQILTIQAQGQTPKQARDIAAAVSEAFKEQIKEVYPSVGFRVVDEPQLPKQPVNQNKLKKVAIAFLLGLVASLGSIFTKEYLNTTIRTKRDVEKYLDLPVIGSISKYSKK